MRADWRIWETHMTASHMLGAWLVSFTTVLAPFAISPGQAGAQARDARLSVTVVDTSNGVMVDATVTVIGLEPATKTSQPTAGKTDAKGVFTAAGLVPGRYSIQAELPGFELGLVRDVRLRAGENKHVLILPIKGLSDSVTVTAG